MKKNKSPIKYPFLYLALFTLISTLISTSFLNGQTLTPLIPLSDQIIDGLDPTELGSIENELTTILTNSDDAINPLTEIQQVEISNLMSNLCTQYPELGSSLYDTYIDCVTTHSQPKNNLVLNALKTSIKDHSEKIKAEKIKDPLKVSVSFTGDLKKALTDKSSNVSTGSLALKFAQGALGKKDNIGYQISSEVSIAAFNDTINTVHGASLLVPKTGKNSALVNVHLYLHSKKNHCFYFKGYTHLSTSTWEYASPSNPGEKLFKDGSIFGHGLLLGWQLFKRNDKGATKNFAALSIDVGLTWRYLLGGFQSNQDLRMHTLGTDKKRFRGFEASISNTYQGLTASLNFYYFDGDIDGFSNGKVAGGISVAVDLIEF